MAVQKMKIVDTRTINSKQVVIKSSARGFQIFIDGSVFGARPTKAAALQAAKMIAFPSTLLVALYKMPKHVPLELHNKADSAIRRAGGGRAWTGQGWSPDDGLRDIRFRFKERVDAAKAAARIKKLGVPGLKVRLVDRDW